ncbi:MAG: elongation factor G, partial [Deltaproteobacteria bacterium]|nr:elongation factor G [Deltaproteobacteria bacterium]
KINLIDTSGNGSFLVETRIALDVADAAVLLVSANEGVQVYTERTWDMAEEVGLPVAIVVSRLDRDNSSFETALESVRKGLSSKAAAVQLPIGQESGFCGVVDLMTMKAIRFPNEGRDVAVDEVPPEMLDAAKKAREALHEAIASADDSLIEKYLESGALSDEEARQGLSQGVRNRAIVPVLAASGGLCVGIQSLLDFVVETLPSPLERPAWKGTAGNAPAERAPDPSAPVAAYVWKTSTSDIGRLSILRVLTGKLTSDATLLSVNSDTKERFGQLYALQGKSRLAVSEALPGDIVAVAKLKSTKTGDTLADDKAPFALPRPKIPAPLITYALHPKSKGDEDKVAVKLNEIIDSDVAVKVSHDPQSKEILLGGTGQVHVEVVVDRLRRAGVEVELLAPKVPYLETIKGKAQNVEGKHKKQTGGRGQFGVIYIDMEPLPHGGGFEFVDDIVGGAVPRQFIPSVEKGMRNRMARGVIAGYPVTDVRVRLFDGKYHDVDSDSRSFEIAASKGFQAAFKQARPYLLEPIMRLQVQCPSDCMGDVIGDLNHRRGRVEGMDSTPKGEVIRAIVPMSETLKYSSDLRSITGGRGGFSIEFSHYDELPGHLMDKVVADSKMAAEEEE